MSHGPAIRKVPAGIIQSGEYATHPLGRDERFPLPKPPKGFHDQQTGMSQAIGNSIGLIFNRDRDRGELARYLDSEMTPNERTLAFIEVGGNQMWAAHGFQTVYPEPSMVADLKRPRGSDLELPLTGHYLRVYTGKL